MCGIAGFWGPPTGEEHLRDQVERMADRLAHRGPDDAGSWCDAGVGLALGHRRLSILDLSPLGHQPMASADGRWITSYNGEIYNFAALRRELESRGARFRSDCDTEVLVEAVAAWGVTATLRRLHGMFALALWDRRERTLWLARDRLGIKPLYYGWGGETLLFASELHAFDAHPTFTGRLDRDAVAQYLRDNHVRSPRTIFHDVWRLPPGHLVRIDRPGRAPVCPTVWWDATDVALRARREGFDGTLDDAVDALDALLADAVGRRMIADVPLGAFLSGGIDSSTVVALMQAQRNTPVRTFSIGSTDSAFDESAHARRVAAHLGTDHTELRVTAEDARAVIPSLPHIWDEPFADPSQIPTFLVSRLARGDVTVALSGDGGDELFGGYRTYALAERLWTGMRVIPHPLRAGLSELLQRPSPAAWTAAARPFTAAMGRRDQRLLGDRIHKGATLLVERSDATMHRQLVSAWKNPTEVVIGAQEHRCDDDMEELAAQLPRLYERMMLHDAGVFLPDDILTKVDRASMAVGLEVRVPILDHRVFELAWRLPLEWKIRKGVTKWPLRRVLDRYVPRRLIDRPKQGFSLPIADWLRGPLRDWAEDLLADERLRRDGVFRPGPIRAAWAAHLEGSRNLSEPLWNVLMFQMWAAERSVT